MILASTLIAMPNSSALAQATAANAGRLQRQADTLKPLPPSPQNANVGTVVLPGISVDMVADVPDDPQAPTLYLSEWQFTGNRLFDAVKLRGVLAEVTGREVSLPQIYRAARMIEAYYAENGYVARVIVPPQEVVGGSVLLEVQEARYTGLTFEGPPPTRVRPEIIQRVFDGNVQPGTPLRPEALDKPLLIANGHYGVALSAALAPGQAPGDTVLLLTAQDEDPWTADLSLDNFGSRSVGEARASAQLGLYSPLRRGDLLLGRLTATEGSPDIQLRYSTPIGVRGASVWADLGYLDYEVTQNDLAELDPNGRSLTRSIGAIIPLMLSRQRNINLTLSAGRDDLTNKVRGDTVSDYHVSRASIGLDGFWQDDFQGGGTTRVALSFAHGKTKGTDAGNFIEDSFSVWRFSLSREQYVNDRMIISTNLSTQKGPEGLDDVEEFFLGGPNGVRAYPIGEGDAPSGAILNLELQYRINRDWVVAGFYDHGWIADRNTPGEPDSYQLKGIGATVSWSNPKGWAADLTLARRLGRNPNAIEDTRNPSHNGNDQDGSHRKIRAWLALRRTF